MATTFQLPVSQSSRELLLADTEHFGREAEQREERAKRCLEDASRSQAYAEGFAREAQEFRDRVEDLMRVIALVDNHNLNFPDISTDQPKEN